MKKQGREQVEALEVLKPNTQKLAIKDAIPENTLTAEAKNELNNNKLITKNLVYITNEYTYSFKNFWTISTLGRDIYNSKVTLKELLKIIVVY